ncbi:hypothetical protein K3M67_01915 [Sphingobium sp. V4]|uniref:hypothetical protein n=1 Tax=Sphingobium sp. V4 TaxID=3038927 RepID=UPI0025582248|nr:hypothetical protein [Sphingobium sp. V4]WIW88763.1 hypothetical protein K3M67_01915 [Sphingobium sp. V4]
MRLADLTAAVAVADTAPIEHAVALIQPFLEDIGWFEALLDKERARIAADPLHLPPFRASRSGAARHLVFARTERIWVTATVVDPAPDAHGRVHFSGRHALCRPLNRAMSADAYRIEQGRAVPTGPRLCQPGMVIAVDERRETLRFRPGEVPLLLLRAQVAPTGPVVSRLFDVATGAPLGQAQADEGHARALMLLSLLRMQGRRDAADQFAAEMDAGLPAQRWAVMREYLALDTGRALPALRAMAAREEDGAVRLLAQRTLTQIAGGSCRA